MKYTTTVILGFLFLIPSVSFASTLTQPQIDAIIGVLTAFHVEQATIDIVRSELIGTSTPVVIAPVVPVPTTTINFGSVAQSSQPMTQPAPNWTINVDTPYGTTAKVGTGTLRFEVSVSDKDGKQVKKPITVSTNDPDLPSSFTINATINEAMASGGTIGFNQFFCVAVAPPGSSVLNGCPAENPSSVGTFDFTFTVEDVSKTVQVTVTP